MKTIAQKTINELVDENPALIDYFENREIDYCCGGDVSLEKAIAQKQLDKALIMREIGSLLEAGKKSRPKDSLIDPAYLSLTSLIQYITDRHHSFTRAVLEELTELLEKIVKAHGSERPELYEINELFTGFKGELIKHLQKEELFVFPGLIDMERRVSSQDPEKMPKRSVEALWQSVGEEHIATGKVLDQFKSLTNNYELPKGACSSYSRTYQMLKNLSKDIHLHIHLEEHLLLSKARAIYDQIAS